MLCSSDVLHHQLPAKRATGNQEEVDVWAAVGCVLVPLLFLMSRLELNHQQNWATESPCLPRDSLCDGICYWRVLYLPRCCPWWWIFTKQHDADFLSRPKYLSKHESVFAPFMWTQEIKTGLQSCDSHLRLKRNSVTLPASYFLWPVRIREAIYRAGNIKCRGASVDLGLFPDSFTYLMLNNSCKHHTSVNWKTHLARKRIKINIFI